MRTTIALEEEVIAVTKALAEQQRITVSAAINLLIRRGLQASVPTRERNGFVVFETAATAPVFGPRDVEEANEREDLELAHLFPGR